MRPLAGYYATTDAADSGLDGGLLLKLQNGGDTVLDSRAGLIGDVVSDRAGRYTLVLSGSVARLAGEDGPIEPAAVLEAFAEHGVKALDGVEGEWALAIWDASDQRLTLARDHVGVRNIHYARIDAGVVFSSTIAPLLAGGLVPREIEDDAVVRFLATGREPAGADTFFTGISRVRAGFAVQFDADGVHETDYSTLISRIAPGGGATPGHVPDLVDRAVARRVRAGESVSLGLSGSSGSSEIAHALTARVPDAEAITVVYPGAAQPHSARGVAEKLGSEAVAKEIPLSGDQFKADLRDFVATQEEPVAELDSYVRYALAREASGSTALFDAQGVEVLARARNAAGHGLIGAVGHKIRRSVGRQRDSLGLNLLSAPAKARAAELAGARPSGGETAQLLAAFEPLLRGAERAALRFGVDERKPFLSADVLRAVLGTRSRVPYGSDEPSAPADAWIRRLKGVFIHIFSSDSFASRPWFDQRAVLDGFDGYIRGSVVGVAPFWRAAAVELWMRTAVDPYQEGADRHEDRFPELGHPDSAAGGVTDYGEHDEPIKKAPLAPNPGKLLDIDMPGGTVARRYPIQTGKFSAHSDMDADITGYVTGFFDALTASDDPAHDDATRGRKWNLTISEKIIAIMQGRSYFTWDVKTGFWAKQLSKRVARTPAGIGLGDPVTMQLAIQMAGLPRVLLASAGGALGKAVGKKGLFYQLVGNNVRAIDGPTEYSVYPSNVSAKLPPKDPDAVAKHLAEVLVVAVPEEFRDTFQGVVVMDANDIGRNMLGGYVPQPGAHYEAQFADNPLGQGSEHTPMAVVFER